MVDRLIHVNFTHAHAHKVKLRMRKAGLHGNDDTF